MHGIIRSLLNDRENFADGHVRAFVERYLDVIEEKLIPAGDDRAHSRFPGHALTPTGVMAIRCKQFHLPDL